jgi:hypothetical protein
VPTWFDAVALIDVCPGETPRIHAQRYSPRTLATAVLPLDHVVVSVHRILFCPRASNWSTVT